MGRKKLLTTIELIEHMRDKKGIKFCIVNEAEAEHFLSEHNYYFKLAAYRANYDKIGFGKNAGKYIGLEFAYLQELSRIDRFLRQIILEMCLNLEHEIKVELLKDIEGNPNEDGYNIVSIFNQQRSAVQKLAQHLHTSYAKNLINKYANGFPIWAFCEIISFGDLCKLCNLYNKLYPHRLNFKSVLLYPIRDIRNAAAHSNCLINNIREKTAGHVPNNEMTNMVAKRMPEISKSKRVKMLGNKPIHDFVTMVYFYTKWVKNENIRKEGIDRIKKFFDGRVLEHKEYFANNSSIKEVYCFVADFLNKC